MRGKKKTRGANTNQNDSTVFGEIETKYCVLFNETHRLYSTAKTMRVCLQYIDNESSYSQLLVLIKHFHCYFGSCFSFCVDRIEFIGLLLVEWTSHYIEEDKRKPNHRFTRIKNAPFNAHYIFHFAKKKWEKEIVWSKWCDDRVDVSTFHASIVFRTDHF